MAEFVTGTVSAEAGLAGLRAARDGVTRAGPVLPRRQLAAMLAAFALGPVPDAVADPRAKPVGVRSGLPWASGKRDGSWLADVLRPRTASFEALRGRPVDLELVFANGWRISTAADWADHCGWLGPGSALPWLKERGIAVVLSVPLFPGRGLTGALPAGRRRFAEVADGLYDAVHRDLAAGFAASGVTALGLRVGWEANDGFPWAHQNAEGDRALWREAYKRVVAAWKAAFPDALVTLNFLRQFGTGSPDPTFTVDDLLQGDTGWFQVLGCDCYTNRLRSGATPADVRAYLDAGTPGHPRGPAMWAEAAREHGKLFEVSEWGAARPADDPSRDVAAFPEQMFDLFRANADILAWECYFQTDDLGGAAADGPGYHDIDGDTGATMLPNTRVGYVARWAPA